MKTKLLLALPLLLGLNLGLTSCQDRVETADPTGLSSQEGGKVSFRLTSAEIATLGVGIDSVRIEAVREGFATQVSAGSLTQSVVLNNLSAGGWTLRVALYDAAQAIHYYGEALVQILPGRTVDAEIHLRKATGSVRVRIILDPDPVPVGRFDTLAVQVEPVVPAWTPLKAWRTRAGVYLVSSMQIPCEWPVLSFDRLAWTTRPVATEGATMDLIMPITDKSRWVLGKEVDTTKACIQLYQEHMHFVPWIASGPITLVTSTGTIELPDPATPQPSDTPMFVIEPTTGSKPTFLPLLSAQRSDSGVHILTQYYCQAPVIRSIPDSGIRWVFGNNPDIAAKCAVGTPAPVRIFVPKSRCGTIQLEDANGKVQYLPGKACVDPVPTNTLDTVLIKAEDGGMYSRVFTEVDGLPVDKIWRDNSGTIWVYTRYDCNIKPRALYNIVMVPSAEGIWEDPSLALKMPVPAAVKMSLIRPQNATEIGCAEQKHLVRIPFPPEQSVQFRNLQNGVETYLPGSSVPVAVDSSFKQFNLTNETGIGDGFDYVLFADGTVQRKPSAGMIRVDTLVVPETTRLAKDSLAVVLQILQSASVRHPEGACVDAVPTITPLPIGDSLGLIIAPSTRVELRQVSYANGQVSSQRRNHSYKCIPPKSWTLLDRVDNILSGGY